MNILRARNRSSESTAMALRRRTITGTCDVSVFAGRTYWGSFCVLLTIEKTAENCHNACLCTWRLSQPLEGSLDIVDK